MDTTEVIKDLSELGIIIDSRIWQPFMEKYDCQKICEVGVLTGLNFNLMIKHNPQVAVAVDTWREDSALSRYSQQFFDECYEDMKKLKARNPFVQIYREYSFDAVKHFPDEYFDLVYIDGDHSFKGCFRDLGDWYPKVKKGKFLVGDDYGNGSTVMGGVRFRYEVKKALDKFAQENGITVYKLPHHGWAIIK